MFDRLRKEKQHSRYTQAGTSAAFTDIGVHDRFKICLSQSKNIWGYTRLALNSTPIPQDF
jgi:hypothetical protein